MDEFFHINLMTCGSRHETVSDLCFRLISSVVSFLTTTVQSQSIPGNTVLPAVIHRLQLHTYHPETLPILRQLHKDVHPPSSILSQRFVSPQNEYILR